MATQKKPVKAKAQIKVKDLKTRKNPKGGAQEIKGLLPAV